jgi:hypothetical protein
MFNPSSLSKTTGGGAVAGAGAVSSSSLPVVLALHRMALVHLPSTRRAVACQHGEGAPSSIVLVVVVHLPNIHDTPCEQLRAGMGAGAGLSVVVGVFCGRFSLVALVLWS